MRFRSRVLPTGLGLLMLVVVAGCAQPAIEQEVPTQPANPLAGAWSVSAIETADGMSINPAQAGQFIFTDGYYSAVYTNTPEARVPSAVEFTPTDEEMVAQHASIIVNTGTYSVSGSTIAFRPVVAKSPGFIGGQATAEFEIAGDTLTLRYQTILSAGGESAPNVGGSMTLTRVE